MLKACEYTSSWIPSSCFFRESFYFQSMWSWNVHLQGHNMKGQASILPYSSTRASLSYSLDCISFTIHLATSASGMTAKISSKTDKRRISLEHLSPRIGHLLSERLRLSDSKWKILNEKSYVLGMLLVFINIVDRTVAPIVLADSQFSRISPLRHFNLLHHFNSGSLLCSDLNFF